MVIGEESQALGGYDPDTRYKLKIAQIQSKEDSARRQLKDYASRITRLEDEVRQLQSTITGLESTNLRIQQEFIKEKERSTRLEKQCNSSISKEQSAYLKAENENMKLENTQLKAALETFRSLHEAAVREAKTMKLAIGRNDDENLHLRKEIRELQSQSDENALIGKLFNQVLTEKWAEAGFNRKFDQCLDDLRKAQMQANDYASKLKLKEDELFEMETATSERIKVLERQLFDAQLNILPNLSLNKLEEVNLALKRMANQKLELEIANKQLRTDMYENQVRLDAYILKEKNLRELEETLKSRNSDELSAKIIELSSNLSTYKLNELKAQRELSLVKEREEYFMRVNKNQSAQIQDLEVQVAGAESKINERENFWRARFAEQSDLLHREKRDPGNMSSHRSELELHKIVRDGLGTPGNNGSEDQLLHKPSSARLNNSMMNASTLDGENQLLRDKIRFMESDINQKDIRIANLQRELEHRLVMPLRGGDMVETLVINDLEAKTRDIASAAQQTVRTLQEMIEDKNRVVQDKEKTIDILRVELANKGRQLAKIELEAQTLKTQVHVGEHSRMSVDQYTALKTMEKISRMDEKELHKVIAGYENKLTILADELTNAERINRELKDKLRTTKAEAANVANSKGFEHGVNELEDLKKKFNTLNNDYKKKCKEVQSLSEVVKGYSETFEKQSKELAKLQTLEKSKVSVNPTSNGHYEEKISVLTSKFNTLNEQLKQDKKTMQELKSNEIRYREKITDLTDQITKLNALNAKVKDDGPAKPTSRLPAVGSAARPASGKTAPPANAGTPKNDSEQVVKLKEDLRRATEETSELRTKLATATSGTGDFIDETGCLYSKDAMAFRNTQELVAILRRYQDYMGPPTNLYAIMRRADPWKNGVAPVEAVLKELSSSGVKFRQRDQDLFPERVPKDKQGHMDYKVFYDMIMGRKDNSCQTDASASNETASPSKGGAGTFSAAGPKFTTRTAAPSAKETSSMHSAVLDKNVDLLKKKLIERDREVTDLTAQLKSWKQTALEHEKELKDRQNLTGGHVSIGKASPSFNSYGFEHLRKGDNLKQIQELEEQVKLLKKEKTYEVEKREQALKELQEDMQRMRQDLSLSTSECANLRSQLERILTGKMQRDQIAEEREKERDLLVAGLKERLEKARKGEEELRSKFRAIERENIDLKHMKEGIDTRIESLNREIRELKDRKKYE